MSIVFFIGLYVVAAALLLVVLRAKNSGVSPSVQRMEDAEQMAAIGRGFGARRVEHDPFATLS